MQNQEYCPSHNVWFGDNPRSCPACVDANRREINARYCPECGARMRQTRRGATLEKRGPAYVCPVSEKEVKKDSDGRLYREPGAKHAYVRVWQGDEVARAALQEKAE